MVAWSRLTAYAADYNNNRHICTMFCDWLNKWMNENGRVIDADANAKRLLYLSKHLLIRLYWCFTTSSLTMSPLHSSQHTNNMQYAIFSAHKIINYVVFRVTTVTKIDSPYTAMQRKKWKIKHCLWQMHGNRKSRKWMLKGAYNKCCTYRIGAETAWMKKIYRLMQKWCQMYFH